MPDKKISQFDDGNLVQVTDEIAAVRSGENVKIFFGSSAAMDAGNGVGDVASVIDVGAGVPGLPTLDGSNLTGITADADNVSYTPDSGSSIVGNTVAEALDELEVMIQDVEQDIVDINTEIDGLPASIRLIPQNSQSADYTLVLSDGGKHIYHPSADTSTRTWTIPANASVAFPIGTAITFVNDNSAGAITIAITSDTMRLAGAGTTGSRTLAANGNATAIKMTSTSWQISGTGLT